jgi:hypothetical protein
LLTGLEAREPATAAAGAGAGGGSVLADSAHPAPADARDWLAAFGTPERRWAAARRAIAIGSAVTVFGFVLPWASGSVGNLLSVWTSVWGLAGAGHWLAVLSVAGLGLVAAWTYERTASWGLGLPAIVLAAFVLGLIWPSLLGAAVRPIGVLVVFVGVLVLGVGGAIQLGARHEAATPSV